ncbi:MAG TPA: hypothetical protein VL337_16960 [Acidimicrobiales bacterium]|nr:hypothetical protein [Acidimicrobiales bacterium]
MSEPEAQVEVWVREELGLDPDQTVAITEMPGTDPRCSPVVTQVAIGPSAAGADAYAFHIERPLAELVRMDVIASLAFGGGH